MHDRLTAPLSFAQERLWLMNTLEPDSPEYNLRTAYRLRGKFDARALKRSMQIIMRRHEPLRTTFTLVAGQPMQVIGEQLDSEFVQVDLSLYARNERDEKADTLLSTVADRPFNLATGPLVRVLVLRLAPDEHVLLLVMHHIVFDGASVTLFNRELSVLYAGLCSGTEVLLDELSVQYTDYAVWQREALHADAAVKGRAYWRAALAGAPPRVDLPATVRSASSEPRRGAIRSIVLARDAAQAVRDFARRQGASLFVTMLAAFNVLLYRYTGQRDLVIGCPTADRGRTELEPLIGFFVNILPLRTQLDGTLTFTELLARTRDTTLAALEHQNIPFDQIVAAAEPARSLGATPLFNVLFLARTNPETQLHLTGVDITRFPLTSTRAKFDLSFRYADEPDGIVCTVQHDVRLFEAALIDRLLRHFSQLVQAAIARPATPIAALPMLNSLELQQLLTEWNPEPAAIVSSAPLSRCFETRAALAPDAIAVVDGTTTLSYRELNARANRLARVLQTRAIERHEIIAIALPRSAATVIGMLAVLKAGGAYLPVELDDPLERIRAMLADAGVRTVLTNGATGERISGLGSIECIELDTLDLDAFAADDLPVPSTLDDLAYVMYTSGSSGRPKSVAIAQRAVENLVTRADAIAVGSTDVVAQIANIAFDAATYEIWGALLNGARLAIVPSEVVVQPHALAQFLAEAQVSVAFVTSALLRHISQEAPGAFAPLRRLISGGDVVDPAAVRAIFKHGPPAEFLNGYGPTETTTFATTYAIVAEFADGADRIPIGRPIANTQAYILDADGNAVPVGVRGQLHIGGWGVAHGYVNDSELTQLKFIRHPFLRTPGARLYATGDLACFRADGTIEYLGRVDRQIKIRGFRVEPDEIESALKAQPGVADAVVSVDDSATGDKRIVAYVVNTANVGTANDDSDVAGRRAALGRALPAYMLPDAIVNVTHIPLTHNGKVDRRALAEMRESRAQPLAEPALTTAEQGVSDIICAILARAGIGRHESFFALGGNSLLAARVVARIADRFGVHIALRGFFAGPSVAELAQQIALAPRSAEPLKAVSFKADVAGLSDGQVDALLTEALHG